MDRNDGGASPFDALLRAAEHDSEAAEGLVLAYAALDPDERSCLVATVLSDAAQAGRSPAPVLALLLAVEEDNGRARDIACALIDARDRAKRGSDRAWSWGDEGEGGLAIARPLDAAIEHLVCVRWSNGELCAAALPLDGELSAIRAHLGIPESASQLDARVAIDRLAEILWRARRERGALPEGLSSLAALFGP